MMAENPLSQLSKPWRNFFDKFSEINTLSISEWKEVHMLAYLAQRYEQLYQEKFAFSFKGPPSKCTEMVLVKKMCAMLNTSDSKKIKEYIDWVFSEKILPKKMRIRSLAFFMTPGLGNEFNWAWKKQRQITKSSALPADYLELGKDLNLSLETYGDLAFLKQAIDQDPHSEARQPYREVWQKILSLGFDATVLGNLV